jgi:hypothetical protein
MAASEQSGLTVCASSVICGSNSVCGKWQQWIIWCERANMRNVSHMGVLHVLRGSVSFQNPTPGILVTEGVSSRMANRALVHWSQGVRHHAESCVALRQWEQCCKWSLRGSEQHPSYVCLPRTWGSVSGECLVPWFLWNKCGSQKSTEKIDQGFSWIQIMLLR